MPDQHKRQGTALLKVRSVAKVLTDEHHKTDNGLGFICGVDLCSKGLLSRLMANEDWPAFANVDTQKQISCHYCLQADILQG